MFQEVSEGNRFWTIFSRFEPPGVLAATEAAASTNSAGAKAGKALASAAVTGLYTGLKFTGLAVRVASGLAASIGKDAEKALSKVDVAQRQPLVCLMSAPLSCLPSQNLAVWRWLQIVPLTFSFAFYPLHNRKDVKG